jgi:hypothetical protein
VSARTARQKQPTVREALATFSADEIVDLDCRTFSEVEAAGIEPASADAPDRASTSVVWALISPGGRFPDDLPTG